MRDRTAGSPAGTAGSADDNICVAYSRMSPETNNYVGKGKAPVRPTEQDADMMDVDQSDLDDDNVTEYSFKTEDYPHSSEFEDSGDEDARSHISLSDDEPEVPSVLEAVDWKDLTRDQRTEYERMFSTMQNAPLNGSWNFTEDYQSFVDSQCFEYCQVFELDAWVLPRPEADYIVNKLLERIRLRKAELKVYGPPPPHNHGPRPQPGQYYSSQSSFAPGLQVPQSYLPSQPSMQPMSVPPGVNLGQPLRRPMAFAQSQQYQHGNLPVGMHPGQPQQGSSYHMSGQMPQQALRSNMAPPQGPPVKIPRKLKINVGDRGNREPAVQVPVPLNAPTPPYPARDRPDQRKTVGKAGRSKTRRQAEADEFPWNRQLDFIAGRVASKSQDSWDDSVYDADMLAEMARTRLRNEPVVAVLEDEITAKQSKSTTLISRHARVH
jgi:hypothetical protein